MSSSNQVNIQSLPRFSSFSSVCLCWNCCLMRELSSLVSIVGNVVWKCENGMLRFMFGMNSG